MPVYFYRVVDSEGLHHRGSYHAADIKEAAAYLRKQRNTIINLKEQSGFALLRERIKKGGSKKIKSRELMIFCRHFASMAASGLNIIKSLKILGGQCENRALKEAVNRMAVNVEGGSTLAASMEEMPRIFPPIMTGMIAAGETGGVLAEVLDRLATHYQRQSDMEERLRSAMIYPAIISVVAFIVLTVMIFFILPTFGNMFLNLDAELPMLTVAVLKLGDFIINYRLFILFLIPASLIFLRYYIKSPGGRGYYEHFKLNIPLFSPVYRKIIIARFARNLSSLLKSGVRILEAIKLVGELLNNGEFKKEVDHLGEKVGDGESVADSLQGSKLFPVMLIEMIRVGEETGNLDDMLNRAADLYEGEVTYNVERFSTVIEPAILVFVGVFVGVIVLSLVLPMFMIYESI